MRNTVVENNALNLSSNAYLNSTTKFVKGVNSPATPPSSQTILPASLISLSPQNKTNTQSAKLIASIISNPLPSKSRPEQQKKLASTSPNQSEVSPPPPSQAELTAISLSANIFMNSTTKFVKGFADLTPVKQPSSRSPKQKKSLSEAKKKQSSPSPKKNIDPQANPSTVKKQRSSEKNAMDMAASNYMNSTTKYTKPKMEVDIAKGKIQKLVRNSQKLQDILSRQKGRPNNGERSHTKSRSSSGSKISRRKDRTKDLKFLQKKQPEQSQETVKNRPTSIDFNHRRNDTKIIQQTEKPASKPQISQLILNSHHYNGPHDAKHPSIQPSISSFGPQPPLNRLSRKVNQIKSADTRRSDAKEETGKPFTRQPQNARPQLIQKPQNQVPKSATTLPSGELPLQTPMKMKIQSSKLIGLKEHKIQHANPAPLRAQPPPAPISIIKEERSSAILNTKTTITNRKSINYGSTKEEISTHTHIQESSTPIASTLTNTQSKSPPSRLTTQEPVLKTKPSNEEKNTKQTIPAKEPVRQVEIKSSPKQSKKEEICIKKQSSLKRSIVLIQICFKNYLNSIRNGFNQINGQSKSSKTHSREAMLLALATVNTYKSIQNSFKIASFEHIKRITSFKMPVKKQFSSNFSREIAAGIIFRILMIKQRESFQVLKRNKAFSSAPIIQNRQKKSNSKQEKGDRTYHLQQLKKIIQSLLQSRIKISFNKILLTGASQLKKPIQKQPTPQQARSPQKYTRPPRDYQAEKIGLLQTKNELESTISSIQTRMADRKRYSDLEKVKMLKKQDQLTKKNRAGEDEVLQKRKLNKELKSQVEQLGQKQDLDISLPEYEPFIGLLTEIYTSIFSSNEQPINMAALTHKYELHKEDHSALLDQWNALALNASLKSQIAKWEGENPFNCSKEILKSENEVLSKLMRSYVRERYLWEWVKMTAQKT